MSREIRRVPAYWQHPKDADGEYVPLWGRSFNEALATWQTGKSQWDVGYVNDHNGGWTPKVPEEAGMSWEEWCGEEPLASDYMPEWPAAVCTHIQLYEITSEGRPVSPLFPATQLRELCEWLATGIDTFAGMTATADEWYDMLKGYALPTPKK